MSVEEFDGDFTMTRFGPWKRGRPETKIYGCYKIDVNYTSLRFDTDIYPNMDIDKEVKIAARKASPSIVSIYIQGDGDEDMYGCGTIIDSEYVNGKYIATILTSASLLSSGGKNQIHIHVQLADGTKFEANLFSYDWHYNIATLRIDSTTPFSKCTIRFLDDSISIDPELNMKRGVESSQESDFFNLIPGDTVIAVGRYWEDSSLMVAPGAFSIELCENLDCKELFKAECRITKNGLGGPLLNRNGDVIGVNFYEEKCTPFLAINVVCKCLEYSKRCGKFPHPELGIVIANLYATRMDKLDIVFRKFPKYLKESLLKRL